MTSPTPQFTAPLLTPRRLAALLDAAVLDPATGAAPAAAPLVLDVRWRLGGPPGRADHEAGHVPGAVFVDLDTELAAPPGAGGRHPLPDPAVLQEVLRRAGVSRARPGWSPTTTTRVPSPRGRGGCCAGPGCRRTGSRCSTAASGRGSRTGLPVTAAPSRPAPGDVVVRPGGMPVVDADGAAELARHGVLLDARAGARYRGETEPVDAQAGHVPGARNAPATEHLGPDGRWLPPDVLARRYGGARCRPGRRVRRRRLLRLRCQRHGRRPRAGVRGPPRARRARRALPGLLVAVVRRPRPPRRDRRRAVSGRAAVLARTSGRSTGARRRRDHLGSPP